MEFPLKLLDYAKPSYGYFASLVLLEIAKPNPDVAVMALWEKLHWPPAYFQVFPSTSSLPSAVGVDMGSMLWVGINGTDSFSQVLKYANPNAVVYQTYIDPTKEGYIPFRPQEDFLDRAEFCNRQFDSWGREVYTRMRERVGNRNPDLMLCGHSYGGAVVTAAAGFAATLGGFNRIALTTFGAPKVYGDKMNKRLNSVNVCRWMNLADPVPALPPSQGEVGIPLKIFKRLGLDLFLPPLRQPKGGRIIMYDGRITPGNTTKITPTMLDLAFRVPEGGAEIFRPAQHYLTQYAAQLHLAAHRLHEFTTESDTALEDEAIPVRLVLTILRGLSMIQPTETPFVPKNYRPIVQRNGDGWCVNWMGHVVMFHDAKTKCKTFAKVLNHLLRRTLLSNPNYTVSFQQAFGEFADAAFAGGNGFRPDISNWSPT